MLSDLKIYSSKGFIYHLAHVFPHLLRNPGCGFVCQLVRVEVISTRSGFHWGVAGNAMGCRHGFPSMDVRQACERVYCRSLVGVGLPGVIDILGC